MIEQLQLQLGGKNSSKEEKKIPNTRADTVFRQRTKQIIEEHFGLQEFERKQITVVSRKTGIPVARALSGVVYGDGGPYFECERSDLTEHVCEIKSQGRYFNLLSTKDHSVSVYLQKQNVKAVPNPPCTAILQKRIFREEGYADYRENKIYINPDEIYLVTEETKKPLENTTIAHLFEKKFTNPEDTLRKRTLIFVNCELASEETLCSFLIERKIIQQQVQIREFARLGRKQEGRTQLLKVTFETKEQADHIFSKRNFY